MLAEDQFSGNICQAEPSEIVIFYVIAQQLSIKNKMTIIISNPGSAASTAASASARLAGRGSPAEQAFFGGSIEFYLDPKDGLEHIYVLKEDEAVWQILPQTIRDFISEPRRVNKAPALAAAGVGKTERVKRGFQPLGHNASPPAFVATSRTMMALDALISSTRYNLRIHELRQLPRNPRIAIVAVPA
ncbi:hypothetical protein F5B20DRAFT_593957 [Whalleya microplaca]|nr:hypothetical protein F5B20DRAFT_593957 [Whalleya microplaca]